MERFKELGRYQKIILILLAVMLVVFTVLYSVVSARVGLEYAGSILVPREENGGTIYSGKIQGKDTVITVTADKTVTLQYGEKTYGPYTAKEDPTAVPEDDDLAEYMTGVEIRNNGEIIFRGGVLQNGNALMLFDEDGGYSNMTFTVMMSDGIERDENGNPVDRMKPSAATILDLMKGPELTRKGEWIAWATGVFIVLITAVSILFADDLFYISMSFRVADPYSAEPSDWEIAGRYIGWTVMPIMALVVFVMGLL